MQDRTDRALILETARAQFARNPRAFTLAQVCRETGLGRAKLRKHFPTKKILLACLPEATSRLPDRITPRQTDLSEEAAIHEVRIGVCERTPVLPEVKEEGIACGQIVPPKMTELPPVVTEPPLAAYQKECASVRAAFQARAATQQILARAEEESRHAQQKPWSAITPPALPRLAAAAGLVFTVLTVSVVSYGSFARTTLTPPAPVAEQHAAVTPEVLIIDATGAAPDPMFQETPPALRDVVVRARRGETQAQVQLAQSFLRGDGFAADPIAAARWGDEAAAQGDATAQFILGSLYADGIKPNPRLAFDWFSAAASRGNVRAMHNLAIAYLNGSGVTQDAKAAAAWFEKAASAGYRDSAFDLAVLYERGEGVAQNGQDALKWYDQAASFGDPEAMQRATYLRSQLWQIAKR